MTRQRLYIAGPYSAKTARQRAANVDGAIRAALALIRLGHVPFCPHLSHYLDAAAKLTGKPIPYEEWMRYDLDWLAVCEGLVFLGPSPGANRERDAARARGLTIYMGVAEVPPANNIFSDLLGKRDD